MDTNIVTVPKGTMAKDALQKMIEHGVWSIVVTDGDQMVGVMTERDFLRRCILKGLNPEKTPVEELMSSPLITIDADAPIGEALQTMVAKNVRRLYVKDSGKIIGRITQTGLTQKTLDIFVALSSLYGTI